MDDYSGSQVVSRRNDSAFVESPNQLHNNLPGPVVVDQLELPDVSVSLHESQELDDDFRHGSNQNLFQFSKEGTWELLRNRAKHYLFSAFSLGVHHGVEGIGQWINSDHFSRRFFLIDRLGIKYCL